MTGRGRVWALAVALCVGFGLLWVGEIYWYLRPKTTVPVLPPDTHPTAAGMSAIPLPQLPPMAHYQAITARPLFHPNRQPEAVATPVPTQAATDLQTIVKLKGIFLRDKQRVALFEWVALQQTRVVREGETLEGWHLDTLTSDVAEFSQGAAKVTFSLRGLGDSEAKAGPQPAVGVAASPARQERRRGGLELRQQ